MVKLRIEMAIVDSLGLLDLDIKLGLLDISETKVVVVPLGEMFLLQLKVVQQVGCRFNLVLIDVVDGDLSY